MRALLVLTLLVTILYSCKGDKNSEKKIDNNDVVSIGDGYIDIDSNIKLTDSIKIEKYAYKMIENDSTENIELKVVFSKESLPFMKTYKDLNLYIHLYPQDSTKIIDLPIEHQKNGFDNWSVYDLQEHKNFIDNVFLYTKNTKIFQFYKIEIGLFDKKNFKIFGNPYVINNVSIK